MHDNIIHHRYSTIAHNRRHNRVFGDGATITGCVKGGNLAHLEFVFHNICTKSFDPVKEIEIDVSSIRLKEGGTTQNGCMDTSGVKKKAGMIGAHVCI